MSRGQKLAHFQEKYIPFYWTYDMKILIMGGAEGDISVCKGEGYNILKKRIIIGPYFLGRFAINQMMKCYWQGKLLINLFKMNTFYARKFWWFFAL